MALYFICHIVLNSEVPIKNYGRYRDLRRHINVLKCMFKYIMYYRARLIILYCCEMISTRSLICYYFILKLNVGKHNVKLINASHVVF